jgi:hypothetical protein
MNAEDTSKKRTPVRIQLPRKPAAPRHPHAVARAIALPTSVNQSQRKNSCFIFPIVQVIVASLLAAMVWDEGQCSHVVGYAALGYLGGLLMMVPRKDALTAIDEFLIRWGFAIVFIISLLIAAIVWPMRMHGM